jgi:hypothetical protein
MERLAGSGMYIYILYTHKYIYYIYPYILFARRTYAFIEVAHGAVHETVTRWTLALNLRTDTYTFHNSERKVELG